MYEIIEVKYSKEELQTYINKKGVTFLAITEGLMIFKVKKVSNKQLVTKSNTDKFFSLTDEGILNYAGLVSIRLGKDKSYVEKTIKEFIKYWAESNEGSVRQKWQMQATFDVGLRLNTRFERDYGNKKDAPKKSATITTFG